MEHFIQTSYLPEGNVSLMLCQEIPLLRESLEKNGVSSIACGRCFALDQPVQGHPDLQVFPLGGKRVMVARNAADGLEASLQCAGFVIEKSASPLTGAYPGDVPLNFAPVGDFLVGKISAMDPVLYKNIQIQKRKLVDVPQGYGKCSVAVVDEMSLITSDPVIARKCQTAGLNVLQIEPGFVELKGYNTGFLGGACGKISKHQMGFCGDVHQHPCAKEIIAFLEKREIEPVCLWASTGLMDVGSIIPLKERKTAH